jgi:hypothetical protein
MRRLVATSPSPALPSFWWEICEPDRCGYLCLRSAVSSPHRGSRCHAFNEILKIIREYAIRYDSNDMIRCAVCGICWLPDGVAINVRQLRILTGKCKSAINTSFQRIGYSASLPRADIASAVAQRLPCLAGHPGELRKWSIRRPTADALPPASPPIAVEPVQAPKPPFEVSLAGIATPKMALERPSVADGNPFDISFEPNWL